MKTLIIHPKDYSTDFLCPIYKDIMDCDIHIDGRGSKGVIRKKIKEHDRIIMMGHGTGYGLLRVPFNSLGSCLIDCDMVQLLRMKECIFIWCNADQFVNKYKLKGFHTGMFISESGEALDCCVPFERGDIEESNNAFASILAKYIDESPSTMFEKVKEEYGKLTSNIAQFNCERLYYNY